MLHTFAVTQIQQVFSVMNANNPENNILLENLLGHIQYNLYVQR